MKKKSLSKFAIIALSIFFGLNTKAQMQDVITSKEIIVSVLESKPMDYEKTFEGVAYGFRADRGQLAGKLLDIFSNPQSSNLQKSSAAFYLGELNAFQYADILSTNITFQFDTTKINIHPIPIIPKKVVADALTKFGTQAIPAVIRNLAESDDVRVRKLSLEVLNKIESDKDILALRLQKAIKAETNFQKQSRLQAALKMFRESK